MKIKIMILAAILNFGSAGANIYSCNSPSSKPIEINNSIKSELSISTMIPFITSNELNRDNLEFKTPFLIYYAIDSSEDFMQLTVKYEIAKLQESCKLNSKVQFIAFLNSLYVEKNSFVLCRDKKVSRVNFSNFPNLNSKLLVKHKVLTGLTKNQNQRKKNLLRYEAVNNLNSRAFAKYPLAHPDFLHDLIEITTTDGNLFPNENYAAFINLKSHGSKEHVLAGMHDCQRKAKILSSKEIIKKLLNPREIKFLDKMETPDLMEANIDKIEHILSKLELSEAGGTGSFEENSKLGGNRLGGNRLSFSGAGLGNLIEGLGVGQGLGSEFGFGTNQKNLGLILNDLYKEGSTRTLGFLMLESCESNRNPSIFHANLSNIFGYYTAKRSLWYRNLNWWKILEKADGLTVNMVNLLEEETSKILNIEVINK